LSRRILRLAVLRVAVAAGLVAAAATNLTACGGASSREPLAAHDAQATGTIAFVRARVLALGVLPNGQGFWISARRYAPGGSASVDLTADLEPSGSRGATGEAFGSAGGGTLTPDYSRGPLALGDLVACARRPVTLVLGLLRARSDSAVLRYGGHSHTMYRVLLPRELRSPGALVYGYTSQPVEVVVRSTRGRIVETTSIAGPRAGSSCASVAIRRTRRTR
jgi:hypothetical protein